jgi:alpha-beta hydrolase superfamily lysophospholipase
MNQLNTEPTLPFSRPVPPDVAVEVTPLTLSDGYETSVYICRSRRDVGESALPSASTLPVLQLHGIQSHPGWFMGSAVALARAGHDVFQVVRRGTGLNKIARGDCPSLRQLLDDVDSACEFVLENTNSARLSMTGISWGGKLLTAYLALRRPTQVSAVTLIAAGIRSKVDVPLAVKMQIALRLLIHPDKLFDIPLNDVELFTNNEPMRQYLRQDQYRLRQASARFLAGSKRIDLELRRCKSGSISVPTTLILAGDDRIIHNDQTLREVRRLTAGKAKAVELPGAHTLEFEPDPSAFYQAMVESLQDLT